LALVEAQFLLRIVDVGFRDRVLEQRIGLIAQAGRVQRTQGERLTSPNLRGMRDSRRQHGKSQNE
jgi:hypothetical protein